MFQYLNLLLLAASLGVMTNLTYTASTFDGLLKFLWRGRVPWSLSIGYIIFACVNGQADIINRFLSHPLWQPLSRLSFNIYIIHIGLIEIMYANRKVAWLHQAFSQVNINSTFPIESPIEIDFMNFHIRRYKIISQC